MYKEVAYLYKLGLLLECMVLLETISADMDHNKHLRK